MDTLKTEKYAGVFENLRNLNIHDARIAPLSSRANLLDFVDMALGNLKTIKGNFRYDQHEGYVWLDNGFNLNSGYDKIGTIIMDLCQVKKLLKCDNVEKYLKEELGEK